MNQEITLKIVLEDPPEGIVFGLQKGTGNNYETVQKQRFENKDLEFKFPVNVKHNNNSPNFLGTFVQGTPDNRFIYLDIGTAAGQADTPWSRRLKIPLNGITNELIKTLQSMPGGILEAKVAGTAKDGSPACGTVKPFSGWYLTDCA